MKKVYVSGPMTGIKDYNLPAFVEAAKLLSERGFKPALPVQYADGKLYEEYLKDDLRELLDCDGIFMLPGWQESKGAKIEHMVALACGIDEVTL